MKKKILHLMGVFLLLLATPSVWAQFAFPSGNNGSSAKAYTIGPGGDFPAFPVAADFNNASYGKFYRLIDNLTIAVSVNGPVAGITLDGQNYTITLISTTNALFHSAHGAWALENSVIKNLTVKAPALVNHAILVRNARIGCIFENIRVEGPIIGSAFPGEAIGGLVGETHGGSITNCRAVVGAISAAGRDFGGLVGKAENCNISKSYATADVSQTGVGNFDINADTYINVLDANHFQNIGGLVGHLGVGSVISDCFSWGDVSTTVTWGDIGTPQTFIGNTCTGGPTGVCNATVSKAANSVTFYNPNLTDANVGGLVGRNQGSISRSYTTGSVSSNGPGSPNFHQGAYLGTSSSATGTAYCNDICVPPAPPCPTSSSATCSSLDATLDAVQGGRKPHYVGAFVGQNAGSVAPSCYQSDVAAVVGLDPGYFGVNTSAFNDVPVQDGVSVAALTSPGSKNLASYGGFDQTGLTWNIVTGTSYPLLSGSLITPVGQKDYVQGLLWDGNETTTSAPTHNLPYLCSKNNYGEGTPLATRPTSILNSTFKISGSFDDHNSKHLTALTYVYGYFANTPAIIVPASVVSPPATDRLNDGIEPFAAYVNKATSGTIRIEMLPNGIAHGGTYGWYSFGYGGVSYTLATINPRPTVEWKGIFDVYKGWTRDWNNVLNYALDRYNTICYDYRDEDMNQSTMPNDVAYQKLDSAYFRVELTGMPPFSYYYDVNNTSNNSTANGQALPGTDENIGVFSPPNALLGGVNTSLTTKMQALTPGSFITVNPALPPTFWATNGIPKGDSINYTTADAANSRFWKQAASMAYVHIVPVLPNPVKNTSPTVGGKEPRYTGYNLILDQVIDPSNPLFNNPGYNSSVGPFNSYLSAEYRVQDGFGCVSERTAPGGATINGVNHDLYPGDNANNGPYQGYDYAYTPYFNGTVATVVPYDTVIKNPLPIMTFPYRDTLAYHGDGVSLGNTPLMHNDTVVCEGDTVLPIRFNSPLIDRNDSPFNKSQKYFWRWINEGIDQVAAGSPEWGATMGITNPTRDTIPSINYRKPFWGGFDGNYYNPARQIGISVFGNYYYYMKDTIFNKPMNNDKLLDIYKNPPANPSSYFWWGDIDTIFTNDDHLKDTAGALKPTMYRDTVSRTWIRVTPFFVNVKGGACYAKMRNLGYTDWSDQQYRGVTDFGITVNPRPNLFEPDTQIVCFGDTTRQIVLRTHIRDGVIRNNRYERADSVWYSIYNFSPSMGWPVIYDSISKADTARTRTNSLGSNAAPAVRNNGQIADPILPANVLKKYWPHSGHIIPSFTSMNGERTPLYDTIRVIPYFKNRDNYENICRGRADSIYLKFLPKTVLVRDLVGDTVCDKTEYRLHTEAYGSNLFYNWYWRAGASGPFVLRETTTRQYHDVTKTGYYKVIVDGDCGKDTSSITHVIIDATPVFAKDLMVNEQVCEQTNSKLSVTVENVDSLYWYYDSKVVAVNVDSLSIINADPQNNYGYYQVKAVSFCGRTAMSTLARLWVVSPLTAKQLSGEELLVPDPFEKGKPTSVHVGNVPYGYNDVIWYQWHYTSYGSVANNAIFTPLAATDSAEGIDYHSPTLSFRAEDVGKVSVDLYHGCGTETKPTGNTIGSNPGGNYYTISKEIDVVNNLGITDLTSDGLSVYPNPVGNELKIDSETAIQKVTVTDANGRVIYSEKAEGQTSVTIKSSAWASGSYIVTIETATEKAVRKVVKK